MTVPVKICYPHSLTNFLVIYFNFTYFLCLSPFRLKRTENGFYKAEKSVFQTAICAILSCLSIIYLTANSRSKLSNTLQQDHTSPLRYFQLLTTICMFFFHILSINKFWFSRHRFLRIINFIQSESDVFSYKPLKVFMQHSKFSFYCTLPRFIFNISRFKARWSFQLFALHIP